MNPVSATTPCFPKPCEASSVERRSANWVPSIWDPNFLKTLKNNYTGEVYVRRSEVLSDKIRQLMVPFHEENGTLSLLELVDDIVRLGLGYIFEQEIQRLLICVKENTLKQEQSLHATALYFRLCRQHGFNVSQDVFSVFRDPQGSFIEHQNQDIKGILRLYEASYVGVDQEDLVDEARPYARMYLANAIKESIVDPNISELVIHALDHPLHHTMTRLEARWYIDAYSRRQDVNSCILELAKLNYNIVQATYQEEIIDLSRWWGNLGLPKKMDFVRDRLVESFLWAVGTADEPQYKYCRQGITKLVSLVTIIDDMYDIHATVDEAELFTNAVERWDINALEQLPDYMKLPFLALYNTVNEFVYDARKKHGFNILPYLHRQWVSQLRSYLLELKWFKSGYKPALREYLNNACISAAMFMIHLHIYVFMVSEIRQEALDYINDYPDIIHWASMILRLADDLGTSKDEIERGDVPKAIQCYMNDEGLSEETARKYVRHLKDDAWKSLNAEMWVESPLPIAFRKMILNSARTTEVFYQYGDGHGIPNRETKERVLSLLVDSVPIY
ncbi:hypothetical protein ACHQM5_030234 [Ranunculus cassubicifolius]